MAASNEDIQQLLQQGIPGATVTVEGDGYHYNIVVVSDCFAGLSPVKKQQLVYGVLQPRIADGSVHAVNMQTLTPAEQQH